MSTSGISQYLVSRDTIVSAVLRKLSVLAKGQTPDTEDITNVSMALNLRVAEFRTKGMQLWSRKEFSFSPTLSTSSYTIGTSKTLNTPYPLKMLQAYRVDANNSTRVPVDIESDENFNRLPQNSSGYPIKLAYQPKLQEGVIRLWPTPDSASTTSTITLVYQRPLEFFNASADTPDFPEEWVNALIYCTAQDCAPEWGVPLQDRAVLAKEAQAHLESAMENGAEDASLFFQVDRRY